MQENGFTFYKLAALERTFRLFPSPSFPFLCLRVLGAYTLVSHCKLLQSLS